MTSSLELYPLLNFILPRSAASEGLSAEALISELKTTMEWTESSLAVIRHIWKEEGPTLCSKPKETLSVGQVRTQLTAVMSFWFPSLPPSLQLVSMDWQLGVAMSSSSCRSLHSPYLTLQLKVADAAGKVQQHTLQMTIPEFQVREEWGTSWVQCLYSAKASVHCELFLFVQNFSSQLKEMAGALETAA